MADIKLEKPQQGEHISVQSRPDAKLEFGFSAAEATLEKNGNDLVFSFDDGSSLAITDFYTAYTKENMPDFVIEGQTIPGADFFAALGEELMPAAGPAAGTNAAGGRFHAYEDANLMDGLDRLDGLDLGLDQTPRQEETLERGNLAPVNETPIVVTGSIAPVNEAPSFGEGAIDPVVANVRESGVRDGNEADPGQAYTSGTILATDPNPGDTLNFYFVDANGNDLGNVITTPYGTISIDANGNYAYTLNNDGQANNLALGEGYSENFTVGVRDSGGLVAAPNQQLVVNIEGTNDRPTLTVTKENLDVHAMGTENQGNANDSGTATGQDADHNANLNYSVAQGAEAFGDSASDAYGTLSIAPNTGEYTYTLSDNALVHQLGAGEKVEVSHTIRVQDEHGAWSTQQITITITGTNDAPTVDVPQMNLALKEAGVQDGGNEVEGGLASINGSVHASDVDANDSLTYAVAPGANATEQSHSTDGNLQTIVTEFGTLVFNTDTGAYTYTLNQEAGSATNALAQGTSHTENFTATVSDGKGGTVEQTITVKVEGTNDQPTLTVDNAVLGATAGGSAGDALSGQATGADADTGAKLEYSFQLPDGSSVTEISDAYGTLSINPATGEYSYALNDNRTVDKLAEGEVVPQTHTIRVQDEHGAWSEQQITVNITGTNDAPKIFEATTGMELTEAGVLSGGNEVTDGQPNVTGFVGATDVDGDKLTFSVAGKSGGEGDDTIVQGSTSTSVTTNYGTLTIDADGKYVYELNQNSGNATDSLSQGETRVEHFTVTVSDGKGGTDTRDLTVTIKGTNDKPELSLTSTSENVVAEGAENAVITGTFTTADADSDGDEQHYSISCKDTKGNELGSAVVGHDFKGDTNDSNATYQTPYGMLTLNMTTGKYTFELDSSLPAVQALAAGQEVPLRFDITVTDKHGANDTQSIDITIQGTNDAPTMVVTATTLEVTEAGVLPGGNVATEGQPNFSGQANAKDVDGDSLTYTVAGNPQPGDDTQVHEGSTDTSITTNYGTLTIDASGRYTYTLNNGEDSNTDKLSLNEIREEHFTITVSDDKGGTVKQDISVTITGTNDKPELSLTSTSENVVAEDAADTLVTGTFNTADRDSDGEEQHYSISGSSDGKDLQGEMQEGHNYANSGSDVNATYQTPYGTLTLNMTTGKYTFELDNSLPAVHALAEGQDVPLHFDITVTDKHGANDTQSIDLTIKGTNDTPILTPSAPQEHTVKESGVWDGGNSAYKGIQTAQDHVEGSDIDKGDILTYHCIFKGPNGDVDLVGKPAYDGDGNLKWVRYDTPNGIFNINAAGNYTYTLKDGNVNSLASGESMQEKLSIYATDQHGARTEANQDVTITIQGTNDRPTISLDQYNFTFTDPAEGDHSSQVQSGRATGTDVDHGDTQTYSILVQGADGKWIDVGSRHETDYGVLTIDANGHYEYTLKTGEAVHKLPEGESHWDKVQIRVTDSHNSTADKPLNVEIKGTNDLPVVTIVTLVAQEDKGASGMTADTLSYNGKVHATDIDQAAGKDLQFNLVDVDGNGALRQTLLGQDGGKYGHLEMHADGTYTYVLYNDSSYVQSMTDTDHVYEKFTVRVTDDKGGFVDKVITIDIQGSNDVPTVSGTTLGVVEDGGQLARPDLPGSTDNPTFKGEIKIAEIDIADRADQNCSITGAKPEADGDTVMVGKYGTLTMHADGTYSYELTYKGDDLQAKNNGEAFGKEAFDITVKSGPDSIGTKITIDITGTNDKPLLTVEDGTHTVITNDVVDANLSETGTIRATDIDDANDKLTFHFMNEYDASGKPVQGGGTFTDTTGKEDAPGASDNHWQPEQTTNGNYGSITINPDGSYSYTLDIFGEKVAEYFTNNPNAKDISETFTVTVTDPHGATDTQEITVSIPKKDIPGQGGGQGGDKDDITIDGIETSALAVQEDGVLTMSGKVTLDFTCKHGADHPGQGQGHIDQGHALKGGELFFAFQAADGTFVQTISDQYGSITINPLTGEYVYTLNNASKYVQELQETGGSIIPNFEVHVVTKDGNGWKDANPDVKGAIDVTITGQNDAPIIDKAQNMVVTEDGALTASGSVQSHDVDKGENDNLTHQFSYKGEPIPSDGSSDGSIATPYGTITVHADGTYSYTLNNEASAIQQLGAGASVTEEFTVQVTDPNGTNSRSETITVTIKGTNDAPTLTFNTALTDAQGNLSLNEDGPTVVKGQALGHDVDAGDTLAYSVSDDAGHTSSRAMAGEFGTLLLNPKTGEYEYRMDNNGRIQGMSEGDTYKDSFTITVTDSQGASHSETITVTIHGTNDAPTLSLDKTELAFTEDTPGVTAGVPILFGTAKGEDIDVNDHLSYGVKASGEASYAADGNAGTVEGTYGSLSIDASGKYSYTPNDALQSLNGGQKATENFTVLVNDGHGGVVEQQVTVNLTGTNDKPTLQLVDADGTPITDGNLSMTEDATSGQHLQGRIAAHDVDQGHSLTFGLGGGSYITGNGSVQVQGEYGTFTLAANGTYTYTPNDNIQSLAQDQLFTETFTIHVKDDKGAVTSQKVDVNLTGTNDAPIVQMAQSDLSHNLTQDDQGHITASGSLIATDVDHDSLSYNVAVEAAHGIVTVDDKGEYTYILNDGVQMPEEGMQDSFTIQVSDNKGGTVDQEITLNLHAAPAPEGPLVPEGLATGEGDTDSGVLTSLAAFGLAAPDANHEHGFANDVMSDTSMVDDVMLVVDSNALHSANGSVTGEYVADNAPVDPLQPAGEGLENLGDLIAASGLADGDLVEGALDGVAPVETMDVLLAGLVPSDRVANADTEALNNMSHLQATADLDANALNHVNDLPEAIVANSMTDDTALAINRMVVENGHA